MATLRREISLDAPATKVWPAVRDFGQVHTRVAPGFLTKLEMDKGDRIVTLFNGLVARERPVTADDEACRLVYSAVEGGDKSRLVWTIDLLPDELAPAIGGMMGHAAAFMKKTLEAA